MSTIKTMGPECGALTWNPGIPTIDHVGTGGPCFKPNPDKEETGKGPSLGSTPRIMSVYGPRYGPLIRNPYETMRAP